MGSVASRDCGPVDTEVAPGAHRVVRTRDVTRDITPDVTYQLRSDVFVIKFVKVHCNNIS